MHLGVRNCTAVSLNTWIFYSRENKPCWVMMRGGKYHFTSWLFPLSEQRCQANCWHQLLRSGLGPASALCKHFPLEIYITLQSPPCPEMASISPWDEQRPCRVYVAFRHPAAWADTYQNGSLVKEWQNPKTERDAVFTSSQLKSA